MLILGVVLLGLGLLLLVAGLFTGEMAGDQVEMLGIEMSPEALFLLGLIAGVAILWGITVARFGAKRSWAHRRENRRLTELSEKLDRVEADRARDPDHDRDDHRP